MFDYKYRLWLVKSAATFFLPPIAVTLLTVRIAHGAFDLPLNTLVTIAACVLSVPMWWAAKRSIRQWDEERRTRKAGCKQPPLLEGKSFGNMDLADRFGNGLNHDYPGYVFDTLLEEAGANTARVNFLGTPMIITRDPEVVKFVTSSGFSKFHRGESWSLSMGSLLGKGIFMEDGEPAKWLRANARPYFARHRIGDFNAIAKNSEKVVALLRGKALTSEPCDVQDIFERFTMDTAGEFLFGDGELNTLNHPLRLPRSKGTQSADPTDYGGFANAYTDGNQYTLDRYSFPPLYWTMRDLFHDQLAAPTEAIAKYLEPLAVKALELKKQRLTNKEKVVEEVSYLEHLAASTDDIALIRDQLLNMMLAARDTTAMLLTGVCYLLARHPDVMAKLRSEIIEKYGVTEAPAYTDMKQLVYLRAVINETLRLFPPVTNNLRELKTGGVVPSSDGPFFVPQEGVKFVWSYPAIHKRKDLWGEDAEEFVPQRWLDGRTQGLQGYDACQWMPFHAGPRICLGMDLAYNEASFLLIRILQTFDSFTLAQVEAAPLDCLPPAAWKKRTGRQATEEFWPAQGITMYAKGGMWLRMHVA
ncbi:hypothetical protein FRB94_014109 [Tulasnella sp. JGI-2019a]|nr:hypothetical protein FRB93_013127 [Tulasnella sp. JGI-2019a]KAG9007687.1 hypothetical protein FRB94_014109 [Tulasnella sp. JGI-2019a]